ncbi:hypothetical protein KEJ15_06225 [Candidatus Bathyarchaeota archaeon]|nr:hypothetical protein [Candidatus Bathyarchaeota archaeon]
MKSRNIHLVILAALMVVSLIHVLPVFAPYRDYEPLIEDFMELVSIFPDMITYEVIGKTVQNNDILMFKIGNPDGGKVLFDGAMHGGETLGPELLYFYAKWLLTTNEPLARNILSRTCTMLIPALNVDRYSGPRKNANGVDLNRNFATNWENAGSPDPNSESYKGPAPLSEPESQTVIRVFQAYRPYFYVNLHMWAGPYYAGSFYGNQTYYSILTNKIKTLSNERGVTPIRYSGQFGGAGFAISDAARAGITSFLIELSEIAIPYAEIETDLLPKFIPIAAVLSQECDSQTFFEGDFEAGNFDFWDGLIITEGDNSSVSNEISFNGVFSAKFETRAITSGTRRATVYKNIGEQSAIYARAYFYIDEGLSLDDADDRFTLIQFLSAGESILVSLQVRHVSGEDRFAILAFSNMATITSVYPVQKQWFCLELFTKISSTEGAIKAYINGAECISLVNVNISSLGNIGAVRFGLANSVNVQHKVVVYCDCACISASYIGPKLFPRWDINQDGRIDLKDTTAVAIGYGSRPQNPNWNPSIDVNSDAVVDLMDAFIVAVHFGESYA